MIQLLFSRSPRLVSRSSHARLIASLAAGLLLGSVCAQSVIAAAPLPSPPQLSADSFLAAELKRGSVTLDEPVIISDVAQSMVGSRMFVESGSIVPLSDLLRGLVIQSGNDTAS